MTCHKDSRCGKCEICIMKIEFKKLYKWFPYLNIKSRSKHFDEFTKTFFRKDDLIQAISSLERYYWGTPPIATPKNLSDVMEVLERQKEKVEPATPRHIAMDNLQEIKKSLRNKKSPINLFPTTR